MQRKTKIATVALCLSVLIEPTWAQSSATCDAKNLCPQSYVCTTGISMDTNKLPGKLAGKYDGKAFWHSDVFRDQNEKIGGLSPRYCYYRVVRIIDADNILPIYWDPAGFSFTAVPNQKATGCVSACTQFPIDSEPLPTRITGNITFKRHPAHDESGDAWGPKTNWRSKSTAIFFPDPAQPPSDTATSTLVSHVDESMKGVSVEFVTRIVPPAKVQYIIRNLGVKSVNIAWNLPTNSSTRADGGPFNFSGMTLEAGKSYERVVDLSSKTEDKTAVVRTAASQVVITVEGKPAIVVAVPTFGPSNGKYDIEPSKFGDRF